MLGSRPFDSDFESEDKLLTTSVQKAINANETPVKEKHARWIIIASHKERSTSTYWRLSGRLPVQENPIMAWKYCHVSHKVLRDGPRCVIKDCQGSIVGLQDLGRMWGHLKEGYGTLIATYCKLILQKISFHRKIPQMPGNLVLNDEEFNKLCDGSMDEFFEMSVDMLDYMDYVLKLQLMIFNSLDQSRSNSMTSSGQCRLAPLLPCILDASQLYHYLVKILFKLHSSLPVDTLQGHRERFNKQYNLLKQFFKNASNLQYFKNLIKVPKLPELLPNFLKAYELNSHVRPEVLVSEEEEVAPKQESPEALITSTDNDEELAMLRARLREKDEEIARLGAELKERGREVARVRNEDRAVLESMRSKVLELEAEADIQRRISESTTQENEVLKNVLKQKSDLEQQTTLGNSDLQKSAKANEEKFSKMKDIYVKLRQEHVSMLQKYSEVSKQSSTLQKEHHQLQAKYQEEEIERQKVEGEQMQKSTEDEGRSKELEAEVARLGVLMVEVEGREKEKDGEIEKMREEKVEMVKIKGEMAVLGEKLALVQKEKCEFELKMEDMMTLKGDSEKERIVSMEKSRELERKLAESEDGKKEKMKELNEMSEGLRRKEEEGKRGRDELEGCKRKFGVMEGEKKDTEERMNKEMKLSKLNLFKSHQVTTSQLVQATLDHSTDEHFMDAKCPAECSLERLNATKQLLNSFCLQWHLYNEEKTDLPTIIHSMDEFSHSFTHSLSLSFQTSHSAPPLPGEALSSSCNQIGEDVIKMMKAEDKDTFTAHSTAIQTSLSTMEEMVGGLLSKGGADAGEMGDLIEEEMRAATTIVQHAAEQLAKLLQASRQQHSGINLEVNEKIIHSCNSLMMCIRKLIETSKVLQQEIVGQGRGTYSVGEFYKRHHRWTDGLISAAKSVGLGAKVLLDAADKVVSRKGKFEELMVCAQEIAASTAQLVVASRVKADRHSTNLQSLSDASKAVSEATGQVVASAKSGAERIDDIEVFDFSSLSLHQAKRNEMDSKVRVLELESGLVKERRRLAELRKTHYQLAGEVEEGRDETAGVE